MTPQCLQRLQTPCANMKIVWHGNNSIPAMCALLKLEHDKICVNNITPYTFCIKLPSIARLWSPFVLAFQLTHSHTFFQKKPISLQDFEGPRVEFWFFQAHTFYVWVKSTRIFLLDDIFYLFIFFSSIFLYLNVFKGKFLICFSQNPHH